MSDFLKELRRRRTFAIVAHPDAGKTTLTEKLLLFGGAIQTAGAVKSNKIKKSTVSDFMEIERQRGISVSTSVMGFEYRDLQINILDTPGHEDFAEDTYRTLTAVDSAIVVVDVANGVEKQTEKLTKVCRMRDTPLIFFVNKLDREGKDAFDLLDEIEQKLDVRVRPLSWPIGMGQRFRGVYNLYEKKLVLFNPHGKQDEEEVIVFEDLANPDLKNASAKARPANCATTWRWWKPSTRNSKKKIISRVKFAPFFSARLSITSASRNCWTASSRSRPLPCPALPKNAS